MIGRTFLISFSLSVWKVCFAENARNDRVVRKFPVSIKDSYVKKPKPINHPGDNGKMDIIPIFLLLADRIERLWIVYSALFRFQVWIVVVADKEKDRKKRDHDRITQDRNLRLRLALKTNLLRRKKKGTSKKSSNKNE